MPEFLREGCAIEDNLYPSRIVIGSRQEKGAAIAEIFLKIAKNTPEVFYMSSTEAEAVKLFANTYLAMRVSFFNELDSFGLEHNLSTKNIIDGVSSDLRIGKGYNNPSLAMEDIVFPKIPNNSYQIMRLFLKPFLGQWLRVIYYAKNLSLQRF